MSRRRRMVRWSAAGTATLLVIAAAVGAGWLWRLPSNPQAGTLSPIAADEAHATVEALAPPKRPDRPLVAVVGINDATETTDYLMPYGILQRADVADVSLLSTGPGPVQLYPALRVQPQATVAEFDAQHPDGADYVIVPAMSRDDDPAVLQWINAQASKGAIVIGVCAGAKVVGRAGLLDGRKATTHWYYLDELREHTPTVEYVPNRRMVVDGGVATTTGITASMPMMLTLIEAIDGPDTARSVAEDLGVAVWDARHDSAAFTFTREFAWTVLTTTAAFWNRDEPILELTPGIDEVSVALVADAWSRTYRSTTVTVADDAAVTTRGGLRLLPDRGSDDAPGGHRLPPVTGLPPAAALDDALASIAARYGTDTADVVARQLEYPDG